MDKFKFPNFNVEWKFPDGSTNGGFITKSQVDFLYEYYPEGHKIFNKKFYPDITTYIEEKYIKDDGTISKKMISSIHEVNRCAVSYQMDSVTILMAHLFGNKINYSNMTYGVIDEKLKDSFTRYKQISDLKNFDSIIYKFVEQNFIFGHSAIIFYYKNGKTKAKVLSYGNGDELYCKYDIHGEQITLFRRYKPDIDDGEGNTISEILIDKIDNSGIKTYTSDGKIYSEDVNPISDIPFIYYKRKDGAIWTHAQSQIENHEVMISRLSEDNRTKAKSKLIFTGIENTNNGNGKSKKNFQANKIGEQDIFLLSGDGDAKLIQPASLSEAFKFEFELGRENIFNSMGIVYPKHKSSGDMPTGSMKMMFFPTERKCMELIHEYNEVLDNINSIFKSFITIEYPNLGFDKLEIMASIRLFSPQDDSTTTQNMIQGVASGIFSKETAQEKFYLAEYNNVQLCRDEMIKEKMDNLPIVE